MSSQHRNNGNNQPQKLSDATVQQFIDLEKQKIQYHILRQQSRDKEIDCNSKLAEKSIEAQVKLQSQKPKEDRLTFALYAGAALIAIVLLILFICYLLKIGEKDIARNIILLLSHAATALFFYYTGSKTGKAKQSNNQGNNNDIVEPEYVD